MKIKAFLAATAFACSGLLAPAQAGLIFSDSFETDSGSSVLNFSALANWTVSDGTIDYIRSGNSWGIGCSAGSAGCLDMDGSTNNAGRITSKAAYTLSAGVTYTLEAMVSGNQRSGSSDSLIFGFIDASTSSTGPTVTYSGIAVAAPFALRGFSYSFGSGPDRSYRLFIEGVGGDNIGAIVDDVVFRDNRVTVPEPATLMLTSLALLAMTAIRRRRT